MEDREKRFANDMRDKQDLTQSAFRDPDIPVYRTFPRNMPIGRKYVHDNRTPKKMMTEYDYLPVLQELDESCILIEWDIAYEPDAMNTFIEYCMAEPERIHVAPFRLWPISTALEGPVWVHRHWEPMWWINRYDPFCQLFGFGFIYLPIDIVKKYLETKPERTDDTVFSKWHYLNVQHDVPVHWSVNLTHLHW